MRALKPDVICLQEASRGADVAAALLNSVLPLGGGGQWQAHGVLDNVIITRFDLKHRSQDVVSLGERRRGHAVGLVDLPAEFDGDIYVVCAHFESRSGEDRLRLRNMHAEAVVDRLSDARTPGGAFDLPRHTGFVVLGDLNVVHEDDPAPYIERLVAAGLSDLRPRHNARGSDDYTWRVDSGRFPPNALDRILLGGESLHVTRSFVLNTTVMTFEELQRSGLRSIDVMRNPLAGMHDHLPVVADVIPRRR
jgi:endonuclease/exonuclease/phosphatase family metal-dependent hydrolase